MSFKDDVEMLKTFCVIAIAILRAEQSVEATLVFDIDDKTYEIAIKEREKNGCI